MTNRLLGVAKLILLLSLTSQFVQVANAKEEIATFAGGCFWCVESDFDQVLGVLRTTSGYTGGDLENPTYRAVGSGGTGHREAVEIVFDPDVVSYAQMLEIFWRSIDPTDGGGQFCDRGETYTTAIFANDSTQTELAERSKQDLEATGKLERTIVTTVEPAGPFYPAEDYHQDYYNKNPIRYKFYRYSCGRNSRIEDLWGDEALQGIKDH